MGGSFPPHRDPMNPSSHSGLGREYWRAGQLDESIASLRTALTLSPRRIFTRYSLGLALLLRGDHEAALTAMQQESDEVWRMVGSALAYYALATVPGEHWQVARAAGRHRVRGAAAAVTQLGITTPAP